jgi:hypothetical protein
MAITITNGIYDFKNHTKGDTFKARQFTFPFIITGASILMQFRFKPTSPTINTSMYEWKTDDDSFEIISDYVAVMNSKIIDSMAGVYEYDLQITFPSGDVFTYFKGSQKIVQDISRL